MSGRILVLLAVLAGVVVTAAPASASAGTVTQTVHFNSLPEISAVLPCGPPAGLIVVDEDNGNGVMHFAANANGFWVTATYTGDVKLFPALNVTTDSSGFVTTFVADPNRPTAQGHVTDWFGESFNPTIAVLHDTLNAQLTTSDGQAFSFHAIDHAQATPTFPPVITRSFLNFSCF